MGKQRRTLPKNVVNIQDAKKVVEVHLRCSICNLISVRKLKAIQKVERLRCDICVNPLDLVYPGELP